MCAVGEHTGSILGGNVALCLTPVSARRRQWAAEIDFRISLSPEVVDDSPSRSEVVLLPKIANRSRDYSVDISTGAELSPGRSSISGEAAWPLSASDCEAVSPEVLAPSALLHDVISPADEKSVVKIDRESFVEQQVAELEDSAVESKEECLQDECIQDEFSFTDLPGEPESVVSPSSPLRASTACAFGVSSTSGASFTSASTSFEQQNKKSQGGTTCVDASIPSDADVSIDTAASTESSKNKSLLQHKSLQRAGARRLGERSSSTPLSLGEFMRSSSRPSTPQAFNRLQNSIESGIVVSVQALPFSERSKVWAEQREQRLQRLRDMQLHLIRSGASKSTSSSRRDDSPMRSNVPTTKRLQTLYARDQAWLERKNLREKDLRDAAFRNEVRECTFRPNASDTPQSRSTVTPDRARQLFDRHVSWKQRINESSEWKRREMREASERNIKQLRRSASADAAVRARCRSKSPGGRGAVDVDSVFTELIERNQKWKRARDARIEQLQEDAFAQQLQTAEQVHSSRAKVNASPRSQGSDPKEVPITSALDKASDSSSKLAGLCNSMSEDAENQVDIKPYRPEVPQIPRPISMNSIPGQPVRACRPVAMLNTGASDCSEHLEVMSHLNSLRRCLRSSQSCNTGTWQRTVRVAAARLSGAGAAPLRAASLQHVAHNAQGRASPRNSDTVEGGKQTTRSRTRSPSARHSFIVGARSRDPSPRRSHTPRSPHGTPRNSFSASDVESRQRQTNSPAPRPRPSSVGPRMTAS